MFISKRIFDSILTFLGHQFQLLVGDHMFINYNKHYKHSHTNAFTQTQTHSFKHTKHTYKTQTQIYNHKYKQNYSHTYTKIFTNTNTHKRFWNILLNFDHKSTKDPKIKSFLHIYFLECNPRYMGIKKAFLIGFIRHNLQ